MKFPKTHQKLVYEYILRHDGETLLVKNISFETAVGGSTVSKDIKWLEQRRLIKKEGKTFKVI